MQGSGQDQRMWSSRKAGSRPGVFRVHRHSPLTWEDDIFVPTCPPVTAEGVTVHTVETLYHLIV